MACQDRQGTSLDVVYQQNRVRYLCNQTPTFPQAAAALWPMYKIAGLGI